MKRLLTVAALVALTLAKPDSYREKEDFQYSRSSTDEGTKAGYYGAQRGNMGGNYEKAHNMDILAQNQMSGLVSQVNGELGEGAKTPVGNVFGSGSTRGVYGQGYRDLSNLSGRNFQEGEHHGDSGQLSSSSSAFGSQRDRSHSSLYDSQKAGSHSASFGSQRSGGLSSYGSQRATEAYSQSAADEFSQSSSQNYGSSSAYNSRYRSQSGYTGRKDYERSKSNYQNVDDTYRSENQGLYNRAPIRVVIVPGTKVEVPFAAHTVEEKANLEDFEENILNSGIKTSHNNRGINTGKRYESSFNYRKEWEKHNSSPQVVPLSRPTTSDSSRESLNDEYYHGQSRNKASSSTYNQNSRYASGSNVEDFNSQTRDEYESSQRHGAQSYGTKSAHTKSDAYKGDTGSMNNLKTSAKDNSPKRYESSFSYHKSWERQGDPYVIYHTTDRSQENAESQRLTDASSKGHEYSQYGSQHYRQHRYQGLDC